MSKKLVQSIDEDPFEIIKKFHSIIKAQQAQIQGYQLACNNLENQKHHAVQELKDQRKIIDHLTKKIENQKVFRKETQIIKLQETINNLNSTSKLEIARNENHTNINKLLYNSPNKLFKSNEMQNMNRNELLLKSKVSMKTPENIKYSSVHQENSKKQYIPEEVKLIRKNQVQNNFSSINPNMSIMNQTASDAMNNSSENFIEDFIVVGPDIHQFKKLREATLKSNKTEVVVNPIIFFNLNKLYKNKRPDILIEITKRSFSHGVEAQKKIIENVEEFKQEILETQFTLRNGGKLNDKFFVFTLQGDEEARLCSKNILNGSNPNRHLYILCLKIPDFIYIRDEKHYQRKQVEIWKVQKIYAIATYYPFLRIHLNYLSKITQMLHQNMLYQVNIEKENPFLYQLSKNVYDVQKNEVVKEILHYFMNKKVDYNQVCHVGHFYFGTFPNFGLSCEYALAKYACPIFFSTFSYEEMLLLVTLTLCEKNLVFISKDESTATLCALFLTNIILPFRYNFTLLLNSDAEKIHTMIFEYPFPMISSIKKNKDNLQDLIGSFVSGNMLMYKGKNETSPYVLIDVDSNTILYDSSLNNRLEDIIFSPSKNMQEQYLKINSSSSKSFTFPRKMPVEKTTKASNKFEQTQEEKRRLIKQHLQKIDNNATKAPSYELTLDCEIMLNLLSEYIRSFSLEKDALEEMQSKEPQEKLKIAKMHLLDKHPSKMKLIDVIVDSQFFADYLDNSLR